MPTLVVEDGSVVTGANTYADETTVATFCENLGLSDFASLATADMTTAILRAMAYVESLPFKGYKTDYDNPLRWPRYGMSDDEGYAVEDDEIPNDLINGLCQAAYEEGIDPGVLQKNETRMDRAIQVGIGSGALATRFNQYDTKQTVFVRLEKYLKKYLKPSCGMADLTRT